ncbi:BppU family phage baseplate upper protein [Pseudolactococcus raffinolactis]|uniref:phage baseplate protein n=1 Tax=Pseudolactococcus raffinolactis TaxID=1366 RepID=UPI0014373180|nr:BppU family phage baseplate upper protein [Lactococcus raffinolactis]QIW56471.1 BppU family phage baseplate upper protein [Lactococcus raffinolactis]
MANMIFNLDLNKNNAINPIIFGRLTDGNLRKITVNITNEGEPVDLTDWVIRFEGTTGGHAKVFDVLGVHLLDAENGKFEYTFSKTAFSASGAYRQAYFAIEKDNMRETTNDIKIVVENVADLDAQDAETIVTELNKTITLINERYAELNGRVGGYADDIAELENWLVSRKTEIENIIKSANSTFNQKLSEIQTKLDETNQAIVNGDFYSKTETDQKLSAINITITNHTSNKSNPHAVTANQVGSYTKSEVATLISEAIKQSKLDANPIGTILTTISNTNPSTYIGGTWERFAQGRTMVGVDESDSVTLMQTANKMGGSTNPITEHRHDFAKVGSQQTFTFAWGTGTYATSQVYLNSGSVASGAASSNNLLTRQHADLGGTTNSGNNNDHNNWQPFATVYFWRRTA